jgi:hypothetical protein
MAEAEVKDNEVYEEDLVDYEEEVENGTDGGANAANASADVVKKCVPPKGLLCFLSLGLGFRG